MNKNNQKIVLFDGHSILNRAFYGIPALQTTAGIYTNAVYGFLSILFKVLSEEKPTHIAVAFDVKAPTFRHTMYGEYKGTRKPMPEELRAQVPLIKEVLHSMNVMTIEQAGYEADDLLGTVAKRAESADMDVVIVSGDRDLLQLVTDRTTVQLAKPKRGGSEAENYTPEKVIEKYQVTPAQIIELKALMGDASDNIPGLPGVGEKTATKLVVEYGTIENAKAHEKELKPNKVKTAFAEHYALAELSKELATICVEAPIELDLEQVMMPELYNAASYEMFKSLEFKQFLSKFEDTVKQEVSEITLAPDEVTTERLFERVLKKAKSASHIGIAIWVEEEQEVQGQLSLFDVIKENAVSRVTKAAIVIEQEHYIIQGTAFEKERYEALLEELLQTANKIVSFSQKNLYKQFGEQVFHKQEHAKTSKVFDVHLAAYLLNPLMSVYEYDDLASAYLNVSVPGVKELKEDTNTRLLYEAICAQKLYEPLEQKLREANMEQLYYTMELPLTKVLAGMEKEGILVNEAELRTYGENLTVQIEQLEQEIYVLAGQEFNINSPKQLGEILFEKLSIPGGKKTKTGYSTAVDVLEKLANEYEIVEKVLAYRQYAKLKSTYADGLAAFIGEDGRIHSTFHQTITATGRISSSDPNLQNIPVRTEIGRRLRKVFIPKQDCVFIDADYSQIELRVLAHLSGDEALIEAFKNGQDIHTLTASQVFHVPFDQVTSLQRRNAKAVNFGIVYGISAFGLSQDLHIPQKEAKAYIESYFQTYPKIKEYLDLQVKTTKETGYSYTMYDRRRPVPEIQSSNFMQRSFGERIAMNSPIQGAAADIIKLAMIAVYKRLQEEQLKSKLVLQVHDELLIETYKEEIEQVTRLLREEMEQAADLLVPLLAETNAGPNWYETK